MLMIRERKSLECYGLQNPIHFHISLAKPDFLKILTQCNDAFDPNGVNQDINLYYVIDLKTILLLSEMFPSEKKKHKVYITNIK